MLCFCWSGGHRTGGPRIAIRFSTAGRPSKARKQGRDKSQVRVDMWKCLRVQEIGHCRMRCPGGPGGPEVTDSGSLILQMVKLRGREWLPHNIQCVAQKNLRNGPCTSVTSLVSALNSNTVSSPGLCSCCALYLECLPPLLCLSKYLAFKAQL